MLCIFSFSSIFVFLIELFLLNSNALKKFFYPVLNKLANNHLSMCSSDQFSIETHIESLHQFLQCNAKNGLGLSQFVEKLCYELESFVRDIGKQFYFQETEVLHVLFIHFHFSDRFLHNATQHQ